MLTAPSRSQALGSGYCSTECEREDRERKVILGLMAEAGIEPAAGRQCGHCGAKIPNWRKGRRVSKANSILFAQMLAASDKGSSSNFDIETVKQHPIRGLFSYVGIVTS